MTDGTLCPTLNLSPPLLESSNTKSFNHKFRDDSSQAKRVPTESSVRQQSVLPKTHHPWSVTLSPTPISRVVYLHKTRQMDPCC